MAAIQALVMFAMAMALIFMLPYALYCLSVSLRNRLPGISVGWTLRTFFARANFTPRGQEWRQKAIQSVAAWAVALAVILIYARNTKKQAPDAATTQSTSTGRASG